MSTMKDVAALAQVSIKTVSRVLNGEPHVTDELAGKVRAAVDRLNYLPNQSARRLRGKRSYLIAFIYNNPTPSYVAGIQTGAAVRCRELGYHLVVEPLELEASKRFDALERLVATLRPDGAFLVPPLSDDADLLEKLKSMGVSTIRIAGTVDTHGAILRTPEHDGGGQIARHLIELGHRKIAIIGPPPDHSAALERVTGYLDALREAGIAVREEWIASGDFEFTSGRLATERFLQGDDRPTAILAANDEMALGAMMAARMAGFSIPDDISIAGFDDTPASASAWPPLTTIRQPLEDMGRAVVEQLTQADADISASFRFTLVQRASTAPPRTQIG